MLLCSLLLSGRRSCAATVKCADLRSQSKRRTRVAISLKTEIMLNWLSHVCPYVHLTRLAHTHVRSRWSCSWMFASEWSVWQTSGSWIAWSKPNSWLLALLFGLVFAMDMFIPLLNRLSQKRSESIPPLLNHFEMYRILVYIQYAVQVLHAVMTEFKFV